MAQTAGGAAILWSAPAKAEQEITAEVRSVRAIGARNVRESLPRRDHSLLIAVRWRVLSSPNAAGIGVELAIVLRVLANHEQRHSDGGRPAAQVEGKRVGTAAEASQAARQDVALNDLHQGSDRRGGVCC